MPVSTFSAAVHITPVVIQTFFAHSKRKAINYHNGTDGLDAKDDILFDQAFHIVKSFIELGVNNTIESLQEFTNTRIPVPYWNAVSPVRIPLITCNKAADHLISWFEPEELKSVVGGERWWQVRGLDGVDAEWITEKEFLDPSDLSGGRKLSDEEHNILKMEHLQSVMFYIHGGGYSWGSVNTHRYQISRFARKFRGRAFAVNYRKAPQYPWPCPLQDALAAYLYLIDPPPSALHQPVSPSKIVVAGDSAGGGLSITLLTILRDLGLPMPAGAVLISPWVDLTHSFPSILENKGDIIPGYGFMAKPSTTWPLDPIPPKSGRVSTMSMDFPQTNGVAGGLIPETGEGVKPASSNPFEQALSGKDDLPEVLPSEFASVPSTSQEREREPYQVLMIDPESTPLRLHSQIQMYATTEQCPHPLVSPINQSSLGNLPPLYIIAGNEELLRDEVTYLAHRAASPERYPVREGVLNTKRQRENISKFTKPTKVHLQVFDGMPHVLTVFTFTKSAKYAYRSIAEFVKHVTLQTPEHIERYPFPQRPHRAPSIVSLHPKKGHNPRKKSHSHRDQGHSSQSTVIQDEIHSPNKSTVYGTNPNVAEDLVTDSQATTCLEMILQRVDIHGVIRAMEHESEISALQMDSSKIGIIREGPLRKWLEGQEEWDRKFKRQAHIVLKRRKRWEAKSARLLQVARDQGLLLRHENIEAGDASTEFRPTSAKTGRAVQDERRWGPLDLESENPPRSAICNRRDTPEAYALLKKHIFWTAPSTHLTVPKQGIREIIRASLDPRDDPMRAPRQPRGEEQNRAVTQAVHGLRIWNGVLGILSRKSASNAMQGNSQVTGPTAQNAKDYIEEGATIHFKASRESNSRHR